MYYVQLLLAAAAFMAGQAHAQLSVAALIAARNLPDEPSLQAAAPGASAGQTQPAPHPDQVQAGSISGTVLDINGAIVAGAQVSLVSKSSAAIAGQTVTSGSDGRFTFAALPPGTFQVAIHANGLAAFLSTNIVLKPGEHKVQPPIALPVATASTDVRVVVSEHELATEQIHAEEKQRVFGVLPNFYSSYIWNAAPLSAGQKFSLALRATTDPMAFVGSGTAAGIGQWQNTYGQYGQGAQGFAKRYGSSYADSSISIMVGKAVLPSLLHQDPRYFFKGSGSIRSRALYALSTAFMCRGDNGRWEPNYSGVLGDLAAGGISNAYYPSRDRGIGLTFTNWGIATAGGMADGLVREFLLRQVTPKVPDYARGKP